MRLIRRAGPRRFILCGVLVALSALGVAVVRVGDAVPDGGSGRAAVITPLGTATPPFATPSPNPTPTPSPSPTPTPRVPFLDTHRIVSYYGNPLAAGMGILGEYPPDEMIRRLRAQAAAYQALSSDRQVVPALHLVYAVAQGSPGDDGLYLYHMNDDLVRRWIQIANDNGLLLFLDIQFGRSTVERELPRVLPYLLEPNVHLALDPEFAWGAGQSPVVSIGHLDGADINRAQEMVQQFVVEHSLPDKILVVHQFRHDMLTNKDAVRPFDRVELVFDADGFGAPGTKLEAWNAVIRDDHVERAGIKLFYKHDAESGGLMSAQDVMALTPTPVLIIYQ